MKQIEVLVVDAFTKHKHSGNQAGVVLKADDLNDLEMQIVAKKLQFNETVFVLNSNKADLRLRYFSPNIEVALCGHGTVAAIYAYMEAKHQTTSCAVTIETMASILTCFYDAQTKKIRMTQDHPQFDLFDGSIDALTQSIGIDPCELDSRYPIIYGYTGVWTLLVPIKNLQVCHQMKPHNEVFSSILNKHPNASIHPWTLNTIHPHTSMHGRHFSSTMSGSIEDSVTGTACGVMGAFYYQFINKQKMHLYIEQGQEMGKDGEVEVIIEDTNGLEVSVSGHAVISDILTLNI